MIDISQPKYPVGTKFNTHHKTGRRLITKEHMVADFWVTRNLKGEVVRVRYVAVHYLMGQPIVDYDVVDTTIARGLIP